MTLGWHLAETDEQIYLFEAVAAASTPRCGSVPSTASAPR